MENIIKNAELIDFFDWKWKDTIIKDENMNIVADLFNRKIYDSGGIVFCPYEPDGSLTSDYSLDKICCGIRSIYFKDNKMYGNVEFLDIDRGYQALRNINDKTHVFDVVYKKKKNPIRINDVDNFEISSIVGFSIIKK